MTTYLIGYDLNKEHQNYSAKNKALREAIEAEASGYWRHLGSTWIIHSNKTPMQIRDALVVHLDGNDELLVATISAPAAWHGFKESGSKWLRDNLK